MRKVNLYEQKHEAACFSWTHLCTVYLILFLLLLDLLDTFYTVHKEIHRDVFYSEDVFQQGFSPMIVIGAGSTQACHSAGIYKSIL